MKLVFLLFLISIFTDVYGQYSISGKISDAVNGEDIPYATIAIKGKNIGVLSNNYGFYSLSVEKSFLVNDSIILVYSFVGYIKQEKKVYLTDDKKINVKLESAVTHLKEVVISGNAAEKEKINSTQMSVTKVSIKQVKYLPTIAGEADILKVMQLMPGVSSGAQGGTSMFVRGGDADQNLVLLDEATVYNVGHLFGFFSVFNSDAISDMTLVKGGFGSAYGGRLSSILDIRMKEGNANHVHGSGGIGLLSSRIMIEGPIKKEKMSFLFSARRTYIDKFFGLMGAQLPYYFYDINAKLNYKFSDKDRIFYSAYFGNDVLSFEESDFDKSNDSAKGDFGLNFGFTLGNITNTLRWNHIYNSKLFSNISLINTNFDYTIRGRFDDNNVNISSNIMDFGIKADYDYFLSNTNHIKFGTAFTNHIFNPNIVSTSGDISVYLESNKPDQMISNEFAFYAQSDVDLTALLKINYGLRFTGAIVKGKMYSGLEPRFSIRYTLSENTSLKASYSRMKQYMHRVSSSSVSLPTDLWYPVTAQVKPQKSDQIAAGISHLFPKHLITFEFETFYKKLDNLIEYREGANLILNNNFEAELLSGSGKAYGAEFLIRKEQGRLNGWISYTIAKASRQFSELNDATIFPAKYDRLHVFNIVVNYELSKRWIFSAVWVYQSGSHFTAQIGQYLMPNSTLTNVDIIPIYTKRNAVTLSPSHRLDLNFTLKPKKKRKFSGEWSFGCYNFYNRAQPYRVSIVPDKNGGGYEYIEEGLFGFIPSIAYNFNF